MLGNKFSPFSNWFLICSDVDVAKKKTNNIMTLHREREG